MGAVAWGQAKLIGTEEPMDQAIGQQAFQVEGAPGATADPASAKEPWQEPKLTFIEPKLTIHGRLEEVAAGFFGGFTP
jgi:hypothetical protein